jgi:hypothetical protein
MNITDENIRNTMRMLIPFRERMEINRPVLFNHPHVTREETMSMRDMEFALRNTSVSLVTLFNAFLSFLLQIEADSRAHR